jgi:hypothetical protein
MEIQIFQHTDDFAENKDVARQLRLEQIEPNLRKGTEVIIDFKNVTSATQSFVHALVSQTLRDFGVDILDVLKFKNCNDKVQTIIEIVVEYVQDGIFTNDEDESTN